MKIMALGAAGLVFLGLYCVVYRTAKSVHLPSFDVQKQIADLCALGFDEQSPALHALRALHDGTRESHDNSEFVIRITELTRALLVSYVRDAQRCQNMHLKADDILLSFIHDKIVRLTIGLDELHRQQKEHDEPAEHELTARLERMREIILQSIAHAKRDLWRMMRHEIPSNRILLSFLKEQLTEKMVLSCQMQQLYS